MQPLISILVPVYNVERYLARCLNSIVTQTYSNLEIILVNDGSSDRSGGICDEYAAQDSRIRVIHQANAGVATARNKALAAVSGEYFMFVDSDDYLSADAVQLLYARLISDGSDMAVGKHTDVHEDGSTNGTFCEWMSDCVISGEESLRDVEEKRRFAGAPWGKLYKNTLFEGITYPMLSCGEDTWVLPLILQRCKRISVCSFLVYYYYQHEKSIMHVYNERAQRDDLESNLHVAQFLLQNGYHQGAHIWYAKCVNFAWRYKNRKDGIKLFRIYFSKAERRTLMKGQKGKIWIKWVALHIPFLYGVIHMVRNT